ncbi:GntR family transcriptional regulator YhfZ [Jeotgalibaca ciconiae]|uniref:GntR family transcriptional regulator n=1 Tax=Jeotgalibaca ciconiae TaxID=2496265 RepID=A0A3Q9BKW1_9LACT|nr:GntR family transcriptional regulator YhfZ [Jeotgalibaca ciconiae]AZP04782.1 GntR family transcriptional regulator [Jeotgalibaca ciconiae]HJB23866.1 GntR family transcriptional regulator [Candidatus Jeotgalibaca pullicola]
MDKTFYQKKGLAIENIANELYQLKVGDRMPNIRDFQNELSLSRGTVQNALNFLKEEKAIKTESKGHLGTYLKEINYQILQNYISSSQLSATMPLPYSRLYEGFATGLYLAFREKNIKLNMAYIRGSEERIRAVEQEMFDFAVVSRFAAEYQIKKGHEIKTIMSFGDNSYLSRHVLIFRTGLEMKMRDGLRIGIDLDSLDHVLLTEEIIADFDIEKIELPSNQLIYALRESQIDVGVWNYDEIIDKGHEDVQYLEIEIQEHHRAMSEAVIICKKNNRLIPSTLRRMVSVKNVQDIQEKVKNGEITPRY